MTVATEIEIALSDSDFAEYGLLTVLPSAIDARHLADGLIKIAHGDFVPILSGPSAGDPRRCNDSSLRERSVSAGGFHYIVLKE
jgi:hypothetical protein